MTADTAKSLTARIEVFRPGTFTPMEGEPIVFSAADLRAVADAYDASTAPAPIVVGHPGTDAPAYGWVEKFDYDSEAERLFATVGDIDPAFAEMVRAGRFRKVSMSYFSPKQGHNPVPGTWYPKHVGFLGAAAPAVPGLKNAQFSVEPGVTFEASFGAIEEAASLFRKMRDFFIDRFGLEDADKVLPSWQIEWLSEVDEAPHRAFATPPAKPSPNPEQKEVPAVTQQPDPAFAAREADLTEREKRIAEREAAQVHTDNVAFSEKLVADGKLLPASRDKVVAILDALPAQETVSFAAGEAKVAPAAALKQVLEAQPKIISFGAMDLPAGGGEGKAASFAADGRAVDAGSLVTHQKALEYQRHHPGTEYMDAVRAVS